MSTRTISDREAELLRERIAFIVRDGGYRVVCTDSESPDGIVPRCTSPAHPVSDREQQWDVLDCCQTEDGYRLVETGHEHIASVWVDSLYVIPALLDERDGLRARIAELAAEQDCDWSTRAVELLTAVVDPECNSDSYGNCATHGVLVLEAGAQCPHALARAFLADSRARLGAMVAEQDCDVRVYPGRPGDCWRDGGDDVWVLCADGQVRLVNHGTAAWSPGGVQDTYGPMVPLADLDADGSAS